MTKSYHRILVVAQSEARGRLLCEMLETYLSSASLAIAHPDVIAEGEIPDTDAAVVDVAQPSRVGLDAFRALRARGFTGRAVLVVETPDEDAVNRTVKALGNAAQLARAEVAARPVLLAEAVADAARGDGLPESPGTMELARTRRVIAAGELALRLQHDINNPLAGLLAEVQLLQLDELTPEQRAATDRMLELCRRLVGLVRRLDALGSGSGGGGEPQADKQAKV